MSSIQLLPAEWISLEPRRHGLYRVILSLNSSRITLVPARDAAVLENGFSSASCEPWLKMPAVPEGVPGRVIEVRYCVGRYDEIIRPIIRFWRDDGAWSQALMAAAPHGRGVWRGRAPANTTEIWISPAARPGAFSFHLEAVRPASFIRRLVLSCASPKRAFFAAAARMVRLEAEADSNLRWVYGRAETQNYAQWRARRQEEGMQDALAQPADPVFVLVRGGAAPPALAATCASLINQTCGHWRLRIIAPSDAEARWLATQADPRIETARSSDAAALPPDCFVAFLVAGDRLEPLAVGCLHAHISRCRDHDIVYTDEAPLLQENAAAPVFKPDWSPIRQTFAPYVGRAAFLRAALIAGRDLTVDAPEVFVDAALQASLRQSIGHIRRPLVALGGPGHRPPRPALRAGKKGASPKISIIIPTRDRIDLLEPCLKSVLAMTAYPNFHILVVDNDSVHPHTGAVLTHLQGVDPRLSVLASPGPFNFSTLCNEGVRQVDGDFLVFLNNDTEILQADWLDNLLAFAVQPDIGAVGAKLLYQNGHVQHVGVVLGLGGVAGHFSEGADRGEAGWLGGDCAPHETSAVTAACLMVERRKFEAVGGFDALNLPVDLNDVDLCLRLAEQGWRAICDCRTRLLHHQSASRGGSALRLQRVYQKERAYFCEKWGRMIRDDPYFNPSLSLYDLQPRLG